MKQLAFILVLFTTKLFSQIELPCDTIRPPDPDNPFNRASSGSIVLSSISSLNTTSINAADNNVYTNAKTRFETNPYFQIHLDQVYYVPYVQVDFTNDISTFNVFTSETVIDIDATFDELMNSPNVVSHQVFNYQSGYKVYIRENTQYVRIQVYGEEEIDIQELYIPGDPLDIEICDNGKDDNCDGKTDCDDLQCGVRLLNAYGIDASCPGCNDGRIEIQAVGNNIEFSIDGGVTFSNACWDPFEHMCFYENLLPGTYTVIARNALTGCQAQWLTAIVIGSPPPGTHGDCFNGGVEEGTFEGWTAGAGFHPTPNDIDISPSDFLDNRHEIINVINYWEDPEVPAINSNFDALGNYIIKLGNLFSGSEAETLTYCFTVDEDNKDFRFVYAIVMQAFHPQAARNGWFRYQMYIPPKGPFTPNFVYERHVADLDDPFLVLQKENMEILSHIKDGTVLR